MKYGYEFRCFDQDALNIVLKDKVKYIEPKYNFLANISLKHNKNLQNVPMDTIFIHYHGFNKPWHECVFIIWQDILEIIKKYLHGKMNLGINVQQNIVK